MSVRGQSRRFDIGPATSGLPRATDIVSAGRQVCFVPEADACSETRWLFYFEIPTM
jgi:hypothetical protein